MMCFSCRVTSDAKVVFLDVIPTPQDIISDFSYICLLLTIKFEYMENISRRTAIKTFLAGGVALATTGIEAAVAAKKKTDVREPLKGNVRHSVSKWCFGDYNLDEFCEICKHIGIESVELLDPEDWPVVQKHGLTVAMAQGAGLGIDRGFNDPALHDELVASYEKVIPMVADAGLTNLICFSGRRNGATDLQGWENCEKGLRRLIPLAEKHKVVLTMELLNSVGHKDYLTIRFGARSFVAVSVPLILSYYMIFIICRSWRGISSRISGNIANTSPMSIPEVVRAVPRSTRRRSFTIRLSSRLLWRQAIKVLSGRSSSPPKKTRSLPWRSASASVMYSVVLQ